MKQIDMRYLYEDQTFFTYMYNKDLYYNIEGDEKYLHPNDVAHKEWAKIIYDDIQRTRSGEG